MENKPITKFLRFTACLYVIIGVWSAIVGVLAIVSLIALPGLTDLMAEAGEAALEVTPLTYISIAVSLICAVADVVLGIMALKHKNLNIVYKIGIITMIASEVFTATELSSVADWVTLALGLVVPVLFLIAVLKQIKLDGETK